MVVQKTYGTRSKANTQTKTLDTEHNLKLGHFDGQRRSVSDMRLDIDKLQIRIDEIEVKGRQTLNDLELEKLLCMLDTKKTLELKIQDIESQKDEITYYTDTGHIMFSYYDIVENGSSTLLAPSCTESSSPSKATKDTISASNTNAGGTSASTLAADPQNNTILKWFKTSDNVTPKVYTTNDRASLLDKYLYCTDATHVKNSVMNNSEESSACPYCKDTHRTAMIHDGYIYCSSCFTMEYILVDHDKPSYKDPPKEITYFAYKRINHFNEWLNTVQGKETTLIPDEMFDKILLELKKLRITNLSELTNAKMKDILKKLRPEGGSRYYEHIPHIITKLNGLPTPHLPPELEERLRHMFCQIQVPFLKHACALNPSRKNFLSYSYVLNKFMQLLEKDQYLSSFPLLKSNHCKYSGARVQEAMPVLVSVCCC